MSATRRKDFVPEFFITKLLGLMTSDESKILLYIAYRTISYNKVSDYIAYSQFTHGIVTKEGERKDTGTGLSTARVAGALNGLKAFKVIIVESAIQHPPAERRAAGYSLQSDVSLINIEAMEERANAKRKSGRKRTATATAAPRKEKKTYFVPSVSRIA